MIRRLALALLALAFATTAQAQTYRPGFAPGFRSGFQFLSVAQLWTPTELGSALVAWWDASDTANITQSGGKVSSWRDKVGGITLTQGTAAAQPAYSATARNGTPGVTFSYAAQQVLAGTQSTLPTGTASSVIAVAGYGTGTSTNNTFFSYGSGSSNGCCRILGFGNSGTNVWASVFGTNHSPAISWSGSDRFVTWQQVSGSASVLTIDGVASTGPAMVSATAGSYVSMGMISGNAFYLNGTVQHTLVTNRVLTASEQAKLEGWESWIDGKAGANLPAGHPYKSRAPYVSDP